MQPTQRHFPPRLVDDGSFVFERFHATPRSTNGDRPDTGRITRTRFTNVPAVGAALLLSITVAGTESQAAEPEETSARCLALVGEARSVAAQLQAPHLEVRAMRAPISASGPSGAVLQEQARAGLTFQPLDVLRGNAVVGAAEASCRRHLARVEVERVVSRGSNYGRPPALQAELDILSAGLARADAVVMRAAERLERGLTTVVNVDDLRLRRLRLDARLAELRLELVTIEPDPPAPASSLSLLVDAYERAAMDSARESSFLRQLAAVRVDVGGGAIPWPAPDWYGTASITYAFGHLAQPALEDATLRATSEDLRSAEDELRTRVQRFVTALDASVVQLRAELLIVDAQLAVLSKRLDATLEDDRARDAAASLELERLTLTGRRAYLARLAEVRTGLRRNDA